MEKKKAKMENAKGDAVLADAEKGRDCDDGKCPFHGSLRARGRIFEGIVKKKFPGRIVIELERMIYVRKYERYKKSRTKIHARLPKCIGEKISVGDIVRVQECRPLSKIIHFVAMEKIKSSEAREK